MNLEGCPHGREQRVAPGRGLRFPYHFSFDLVYDVLNGARSLSHVFGAGLRRRKPEEIEGFPYVTHLFSGMPGKAARLEGFYDFSKRPGPFEDPELGSQIVLKNIR